MDILVLLIPLSVVLVLLIGAGFWWSVQSGQFDDLEGPAHRILADDDHVATQFRTPTIAQRRKAALTSIKSGDQAPVASRRIVDAGVDRYRGEATAAHCSASRGVRMRDVDERGQMR